MYTSYCRVVSKLLSPFVCDAPAQKFDLSFIFSIDKRPYKAQGSGIKIEKLFLCVYSQNAGYISGAIHFVDQYQRSSYSTTYCSLQ